MRIAEELDTALRGARIEEVFTQHKNELVIEFSQDKQHRWLIFSMLPRMASLQLKDEFARARKNSLDLLPDLIGDRLDSVEIAGDDRIIRFALKSGRAAYALLFPVRANFLLYEGTSFLDAYKQYAHAVEVISRPYGVFSLPPKRTDLADGVKHSHGDIAAGLRRIYPWLRGRFATELLHRHAQSPADTASNPEDAIANIHNVLVHMLEEADAGQSYVYIKEQQPVAFSLIRMHDLTETDLRIFPSALEGIDFFLRRHFSGGEFASTRDRVRKAVDNETARVGRTLGKLAEPEQLRRQADEYEKFGNLLMIHLYDQPEQPGRMTVPDIFKDMRLVVSIPLKLGTTVLENAQHYFEKAQSTRASIFYVTERRTSMEQRRERLLDFRSGLETAEHMRVLKELFKEYTDIMEELGLTPKGEKDEHPFPFRRFILVGGFEAWVGKNSANNDLLTLRHSRPNDLWFHARGVGGSHVVIKVGSAAGEPSKEAIRQAASIAAWYSKHRKAKRVPVAWTEKKYVRKPKGAPAGTVTIDREKVVLVDPALPE
ncbi:MAG: NFACT family protein [Bacteroidetes bacterium]|nr:NFACT family protein [Bacteroidota bacterium]